MPRFFDRAGSLALKERFIVFDLKGLSRKPRSTKSISKSSNALGR